jgi:hypothetical protein
MALENTTTLRVGEVVVLHIPSDSRFLGDVPSSAIRIRLMVLGLMYWLWLNSQDETSRFARYARGRA